MGFQSHFGRLLRFGKPDKGRRGKPRDGRRPTKVRSDGSCFVWSVHFETETIVHAMKLLGRQRQNGSETVEGNGDRQDDSSYSVQSNDPHTVAQNIHSMNELLQDAAHDGLVQELSPGHFKIAHDRIREAAYSLLPDGDAKTQLHLRIGRQLLAWMEMQEEIGMSFSEESLLLNAACQLNKGSVLIDDPCEKLALAELNFQPAERAAQKSSFFPAIEYLTLGPTQLGDSPWQEHYQLILKLSIALTRIQI